MPFLVFRAIDRQHMGVALGGVSLNLLLLRWVYGLRPAYCIRQTFRSNAYRALLKGRLFLYMLVFKFFQKKKVLALNCCIAR